MDFDQVFIFFHCLFVILKLSSAEDCEIIDTCSCKTSRGVVDLHPLASGPNPRFKVSGGGYTYQFEPCKDLSQPCGGEQSGVAVCQSTIGGSFIAGLSNSAKFSGVPFDKNNFNLTYTATTSGVKRTSVFHITCKDNTDGALISVREDESNKGTYLFELQTRYACFNSGGNTTESKKLSAGSVILIIFFVFLAVYFVAGILFLRYRGAQGTEMIPNYEFWSSLPGYIKDGVMFTCRGCKTESSYSQI